MGFERSKLQGALVSPKQAASGLLRAMFLSQEHSEEDKAAYEVPIAFLHFHDDSSAPVAWNDVHAIILRNLYYNDNLPVPLTASEAYNTHDHGPYSGGWLPGRGNHDHRDNFNGGYCFAVWAPGTSLPQQPWSI